MSTLDYEDTTDFQDDGDVHEETVAVATQTFKRPLRKFDYY